MQWRRYNIFILYCLVKIGCGETVLIHTRELLSSIVNTRFMQNMVGLFFFVFPGIVWLGGTVKNCQKKKEKKPINCSRFRRPPRPLEWYSESTIFWSRAKIVDYHLPGKGSLKHKIWYYRIIYIPADTIILSIIIFNNHYLFD